MPQGGQISSGSGLRLQAVTPGVVDIGNAHIDGVLIAENRLMSYAGMAQSKNVMLFGDDITYRGTNWFSKGDGSVWIGTGISVGSTGANAQAIQYNVGVGRGVQVGCNRDVAIGWVATAGNIANNVLSNADEGCVAIGAAAQAYCAAGGTNHSPGQIAIGYGAQAGGNASGGTPANYGSIAVGMSSSVQYDKCIGIGGNVNINALNSIGIGYSTTIATANTIQVGDLSHTIVRVGAFLIGGYGRRAVADVAATIGTADDCLAYTSISAARIVTLPAANTITSGKTFTVVDESGSASGVNTITLTRAGADTINGAATTVINSAYGAVKIMCDGTSKWTVVP